MNKRRSVGGFLLCCTILTLCQRNVEAGPLKSLSRFVREIYPEVEPENETNQASVCIVGDVVYGADEPVSSEQPCLKCKCQPPGVQCETIRCLKKPGCKAIHKPNKCCPDYQCECEYNGRIYTNGEKLDTQPGGECKVCYCRGGEVKCAEVSCYRRADCEGKTVPGQCCPKYDHCPPKEPQVGMSQSLAIGEKEYIEPWSPSTSLSNTTTRIDDSANQSENHILDSTSDSRSTTELPKTDKTSQPDPIFEVQKEGPKITIQEIIPEVREIPITEPPAQPKPEIGGTLIIEEAKNTPIPSSGVSEANDLISDSDADSSEISEVIQQPPPVLRIGDKLVYLNKDGTSRPADANNSAPVITIIGAEGLQRGFEDSGELHEVHLKPVTTSEPNTEINSTPDEGLKESESSHILSLVKRKRKGDSATSETTTSFPVDITSESDKNLSNESISSSTEGMIMSIVDETVKDIIPSSDASNDEVQRENSIKFSKDPASTSEDATITEPTEKPLEVIQEQNPAYPPIPDVMSPPHIDDNADRYEGEAFDSINKNDTGSSEMVMRILPEILDVRNNKTIIENTTNSEWLKTENIEGTLLNPDALLPDSLLNQPVASDFDDTINANARSADDISTESNNTESTTSTITSSTFTTSVGVTIATNGESSKALDEAPASKETMEDGSIESGELTTPKNSHASLLSTEDADLNSKENVTAEVEDMVPLNDTSDGNTETTTKSVPIDVEMIDHVVHSGVNKEGQIDDTSNPKLKDVEIISINAMSNKMDKTVETTTELAEKLPQPEQLVMSPTRSIEKRQNNPEDEAEEIFKQLNDELNEEKLQKTLTKEEEEEEAAEIFKELIEEANSPKDKTNNNQETNKEREMIDKLADALGKLALRKQPGDTNILNILSNFFSSQYRAYDNAQQFH